jgi:hypothetical protein
MRQRRRTLGLSLFMAFCLVGLAVQSTDAGIEIAEELLVDLRSEDLSPGPVTEWPNHGSLGGSFVAFGNPIVTRHLRGIYARSIQELNRQDPRSVAKPDGVLRQSLLFLYQKRPPKPMFFRTLAHTMSPDTISI